MESCTTDWENATEQHKIALACHVHPTSGHLGVKKTIARVKERFRWKDVVEDVKNIVSNSVHIHHYEVSPVRCCEFCGHAGFYM